MQGAGSSERDVVRSKRNDVFPIRSAVFADSPVVSSFSSDVSSICRVVPWERRDVSPDQIAVSRDQNFMRSVSVDVSPDSSDVQPDRTVMPSDSLALPSIRGDVRFARFAVPADSCVASPARPAATHVDRFGTPV